MPTPNQHTVYEKPEDQVVTLLQQGLRMLRASKPGDRSDRDRRFAICITEVEKVTSVVIGMLIVNKD